MSTRGKINLLAGIMALGATANPIPEMDFEIQRFRARGARNTRRYTHEERKERRRAKMRLRKLRGWR